MTAAPVGLLEVAGLVMLASVLGVGGGNGFIPVIQTHWVATGRLDPSLFAWAIALGQLTPGPKVGFVAGVGYYLRGLPGAAAALVSVVVPTVVASAAVSVGLRRLRPVLERASLPGSFVIAGLLGASAWGMAAPLSPSAIEVGAAGAVAFLIGERDVDPVWAVLGALAVGLLGRGVA